MIVGFTAGTFDLLHAGHVIMLEEAKSLCDRLVVGLQIDPSVDRDFKNSPVQSVVERQIQLRGLSCVDEVIVYSTEDDLIDLLTAYPINIRILGEEYEGKEFTGRKECEEIGIKICFNKRKHRFSSSDLRTRVCVK